MGPNIALVSGEGSGDTVGGALAVAVRRLWPQVAIWGLGSSRMAAAGVELLADSAEWGAIGVVEALKVYPRLRYGIYPALIAQVRRRRPALVVLIDFGAFNVKVARWCKASGVPVLYYFPPGSWRRNGTARSELGRVTDRIATPFPWSAERLREMGANVEFVGHPLLDLSRPSLTRAQFAERFGMEPGHPIVGLLPGSRRFEVTYNTPAMLAAAARISRTVTNAQFVYSVAPTIAPERAVALVRGFRPQPGKGDHQGFRPVCGARRDARKEPQLITPEGVVVPSTYLQRRERAARRTDAAALPPIVLCSGMTQDLIAHADVLLACSGTVTLEAAILGTPMVILYRGSRLMAMEYRLRRLQRVEHIGMPNIIAGRRIVPELRQEEASPERLADEAIRLLRDPTARATMKDDLRQVREALGEPGATERVAHIVLEMAGRRET
ncbi:MAG: hypothetical protein IT208_15795 [Chthonomonadales bacterium]|nr:hypothetical protein [Chthonomonadales bacterium]